MVVRGPFVRAPFDHFGAPVGFQILFASSVENRTDVYDRFYFIKQRVFVSTFCCDLSPTDNGECHYTLSLEEALLEETSTESAKLLRKFNHYSRS